MWKQKKMTKFKKSFSINAFLLLALIESCASNAITNDTQTSTAASVTTTLKEQLDLIPKARVKAQISKK